jgi:hypothetical protein
MVHHARGGQLVAAARRELERRPPDYAKATRALEEAYQNDPSPVTKELLDRTRQRAAQASREAAGRELAELARKVDEALARGDADAAGEDLERARGLVADAHLEDAWRLAEKATALEALRASRDALRRLPPVPPEGAAEEALQAALAPRRAYLADHPQGAERARVEAEAEALTARVEAARGHAAASPAGGDLDAARAALARRDVEGARTIARRVRDALAAAGQDAGPADAVLALADEREELLAHLADWPALRPGVRICRFEVMNSEYWTFCLRRLQEARGTHDPAALARVAALWPDGWAPRADDADIRTFPSGAGTLPVGGISFRDAEEYCRWRSAALGLTVRLPTEAEWVQAATGGDGRTYPWGSTWVKARAVFQTQGPVSVSAPWDGQSPLGLCHMAGNVAEWVDTPWGDETGTDPSSRLLKGGSYRSLAPDALSVQARARAGVTERKPEWGFRVIIELPE